MAPRPERLRFVTFLSPEMCEVYDALVRYVGKVLERSAVLCVGTHDYDVFAKGEADFGFI
ncbi:MAG: hypothetical protein HY876_07790 [Coriobacteriales bacterium]|nr:hypothetical protein [Coriobacteriales bacterium]